MAEILRFATAGSVDDGKSTLIGRMLYDTKTIFQDQLEAVERTSEQMGNDYTNLALLTDGLRAEREQGITIDVAYRYFSTARRKFIIADTPGHEQYTRNMATGASTCNLAVILIAGRLLRLDLAEIVIASNANMGGPTSAAAMAVARRWDTLVIPAILCGTLGYATATFIGVAVGHWLR